MKIEESGMLVKYIKDGKRKHNRSYAVVVAVDRNKVGWSQVNETDLYNYISGELIHKKDFFDKEKGLKIARARAYECIDNGQYGAGSHVKVPHDLIPHLNEMMERSRRYFK